jgi:hypothetical protein
LASTQGHNNVRLFLDKHHQSALGKRKKSHEKEKKERTDKKKRILLI